MCGIIGYAGKAGAEEFLLQGLKRLEYRGYDSAGIAVLDENEIQVVKCQGTLEKLEKRLRQERARGYLGIGHTRWATHGVPSDTNSHPHQDCQERFALVHNGIIENYQTLKADLKSAGHSFCSETDTEVLVHLLEEIHQGEMVTALRELQNRLVGSYALAVVDNREPDKIYALRQESPLVIGLGEEENYLASDMPALLNATSKFHILEDGDLAVLSENDISIFSSEGKEVKADIFQADWDDEMVQKQGYEHFMLKEIYEQPTVARRLLSAYLEPDRVNLPELTEIWDDEIDRVLITACGTAYYSGLAGRHILEELANLPVEVEIASELRYKKNFLDDKSLLLVVSQSGETADTLAALKLGKNSGSRVLALTNTIGSSIAREADAVIDLKAGPEIAVASTKAYLAMLTAFYLTGIKLAGLRATLPERELHSYRQELLKLPEKITAALDRVEESSRKAADYLKDYNSMFYIGRNLDYSLALEGALKLKEISYLHAEAYPAGELKHGTLALVEEGVPVMAIFTRRGLVSKTLSNVKEVKARGGKVIAIATAGTVEDKAEFDKFIELPACNELWAGVLTVLPLQLLAYHTAHRLGCSIDKPRNLAKSVTVE